VDISLDIITQPMALLGAVGYLIYLYVEESDLVILLLFLTVLPLFIFLIRKIGERLRRKSRQMQGRTAEIINRLNHNLAAINDVRAFGLEKQEVGSYHRACHAFSDAFLKVSKYQLIVAPLVEIISAIGVGFTMFYASKRGLKLEVFMSLATALYFGYDAIKRLGDISNKIIMISHRFSMISIVDEVFAFPHGRIVESGAHGNLLAGDTLYRKLYEKQKVIGA
jgi:subfamily B ATP-binding cassette protein MsbA